MYRMYFCVVFMLMAMVLVECQVYSNIRVTNLWKTGFEMEWDAVENTNYTLKLSARKIPSTTHLLNNSYFKAENLTASTIVMTLIINGTDYGFFLNLRVPTNSSITAIEENPYGKVMLQFPDYFLFKSQIEYLTEEVEAVPFASENMELTHLKLGKTNNIKVKLLEWSRLAYLGNFETGPLLNMSLPKIREYVFNLVVKDVSIGNITDKSFEMKWDLVENANYTIKYDSKDINTTLGHAVITAAKESQVEVELLMNNETIIKFSIKLQNVTRIDELKLVDTPTENGAVLTWMHSSSMPTGYLIEYYSNADKMMYMNTTANSATFKSLTPDTKYTVNIRPFYSDMIKSLQGRAVTESYPLDTIITFTTAKSKGTSLVGSSLFMIAFVTMVINVVFT